MELLEESSSYGEPTEFLEEFFRTGHTQWLGQKHGPDVQFGRDRVNNAIMVLWLRASRMHTNHILGRPNSGPDRPFFSDEGLYDNG